MLCDKCFTKTFKILGVLMRSEDIENTCTVPLLRDTCAVRVPVALALGSSESCEASKKTIPVQPTRSYFRTFMDLFSKTPAKKEVYKGSNFSKEILPIQDLVSHIASFLPITDFVHATQVCKSFRNADDDLTKFNTAIKIVHVPISFVSMIKNLLRSEWVNYIVDMSVSSTLTGQLLALPTLMDGNPKSKSPEISSLIERVKKFTNNTPKEHMNDAANELAKW